MEPVFGILTTVWKNGSESREIAVLADGCVKTVHIAQPADEKAFESGVETAAFNAGMAIFDALYDRERQEIIVPDFDINKIGNPRSVYLYNLPSLGIFVAFRHDGTGVSFTPSSRPMIGEELVYLMADIVKAIEAMRLELFLKHDEGDDRQDNHRP